MKVFLEMKSITSSKRNGGFALVEILVGLVLMGVMGLALTKSSVMSIKMRNKTVVDSIATQLAQERMEEFAGTNPNTLSNGDTWNETITRYGKNFTRTTVVTVNPDQSRMVQVNVNATLSPLGGNAAMSNTYPLWGAG